MSLQGFFADVMECEQLASLYDFENRRKRFPEVDSRYKFSLLTLAGSGAPEAKFAFFLYTTDEMTNPDRRFTLGPSDLALINPNTRTVPVFRTRRDAELARKLYRASPVLVNECTGENPWSTFFKQGLFNMTSDSHLFYTREQLETEGFVLESNWFVREDETYVPIVRGADDTSLQSPAGFGRYYD